MGTWDMHTYIQMYLYMYTYMLSTCCYTGYHVSHHVRGVRDVGDLEVRMEVRIDPPEHCSGGGIVVVQYVGTYVYPLEGVGGYIRIPTYACMCTCCTTTNTCVHVDPPEDPTIRMVVRSEVRTT